MGSSVRSFFKLLLQVGYWINPIIAGVKNEVSGYAKGEDNVECKQLVVEKVTCGNEDLTIDDRR